MSGTEEYHSSASYNPNRWSQNDMFVSIKDCVKGIENSHLLYGTLEISICPKTENLFDAYDTYMRRKLKTGYIHVERDPNYMEAWPDFVGPEGESFIGSPEYNGMRTLQNKVVNAQNGINSPVDALDLLRTIQWPESPSPTSIQ